MYMHVYLSTVSGIPSALDRALRANSDGVSAERRLSSLTGVFRNNLRSNDTRDDEERRLGGDSVNEHGRVSTYGEENRRRDDFRDPEQPFWRLVGRIKRRRRDFPGRSRLHASSVERKRPTEW